MEAQVSVVVHTWVKAPTNKVIHVYTYIAAFAPLLYQSLPSASLADST